MIPIDGNNILRDDRAILVTSFMANHKLNFGEILSEEIKILVSRSDTAYPFPCLITRLCRVANVPNIVGLEEELLAKKTHKSIQNEENQLRLMLDRGVESPADPPITGTSSMPDVEV